jgi:hypothetical protein
MSIFEVGPERVNYELPVTQHLTGVRQSFNFEPSAIEVCYIKHYWLCAA